MMAKEYKSRGGGYKTEKKDQDESQKHLSKWTEEGWQTKEGSGEAKKSDGTRKRYLPKKAWEEMGETEKQETEEQKQEGSKEGKQFVPNTSRARSARKKANQHEDEAFEKRKEQENGGSGRQTRSSTKRQGQSEKAAEENEGSKDEKASVPRKAGEKRRRSQETENDAGEKPPRKKQKESTGSSKKKGENSIGSNHDKADPPAEQGSKSRLPKKGQAVYWKSLPGWVEGSVVEVVKTRKEMDGKQVKASKDDPRIVLKSSSSGKIAVHKPDAVYFD